MTLLVLDLMYTLPGAGAAGGRNRQPSTEGPDRALRDLHSTDFDRRDLRHEFHRHPDLRHPPRLRLRDGPHGRHRGGPTRVLLPAGMVQMTARPGGSYLPAALASALVELVLSVVIGLSGWRVPPRPGND